MEYGELVYACALSDIFNYSCGKGKFLIDNYPVPSTVFSLSAGELKDIFGASSPFCGKILDHSYLEKAASEVQWAENHGVKVIFIGDSDYPYRLKECNDAPIVLYYIGTANLNSSRMLSIVGTRKVTQYGKDMCGKIIEELSTLDIKPVIISGLAYGVDICAHQTALSCSLETIGVMATGLDEIYPRLHRPFAAKMVRQGGLVSDFPRGTTPVRLNFIRRNRIIAGLSDATVLIESEVEGGGVVTSKMAYSYSREVFAVPGRMTDRRSSGCNALIRDNIASLVAEGGGVVGALGWSDLERKGKYVKKALIFESDNPIKKNILLSLSSHPALDFDTILESSPGDYKEVVCNITELELEDRIKSDGTGKYTLA